MNRREQEIKVVERMIRLYCSSHHKAEPRNTLCPECRTLADYAAARVRLCPLGDAKRSCRVCHIHCYNPEMKQRIRAVMRYSGPRMIFVSPIAAIRHLLREKGL